MPEANDDRLLTMLHDDFRTYDEAYAVENTQGFVLCSRARGRQRSASARPRRALATARRKAAQGIAKGFAHAPGADSAEAIAERTLEAQRVLVASCGL